MLEGSTLCRTSTFEIGRAPAGRRGARRAPAANPDPHPVGEWQENTSRVAALHITHKRQKRRDARRSRAAPLSPRPRTGLSFRPTVRSGTEAPSRASPSVGAARAPDRSAGSGRRSYDGRRLAAPTRTRTNRTNDGAGRRPRGGGARVPRPPALPPDRPRVGNRSRDRVPGAYPCPRKNGRAL